MTRPSPRSATKPHSQLSCTLSLPCTGACIADPAHPPPAPHGLGQQPAHHTLPWHYSRPHACAAQAEPPSGSSEMRASQGSPAPRAPALPCVACAHDAWEASRPPHPPFIHANTTCVGSTPAPQMPAAPSSRLGRACVEGKRSATTLCKCNHKRTCTADASPPSSRLRIERVGEAAISSRSSLAAAALMALLATASGACGG